MNSRIFKIGESDGVFCGYRGFSLTFFWMSSFCETVIIDHCLLIGSFMALFYCILSPFSLLFYKVRGMRGNGVLELYYVWI